MSDPRDPLNPRNPDPYVRPKSEPVYRDEAAAGPSAMWGWIAGGVVVVLVLAFIFGMRDTTDTASNDVTPTTTTPRVVNPAPNATPPATTGQAPSATPPSTTGQAPGAPAPATPPPAR